MKTTAFRLPEPMIRWLKRSSRALGMDRSERLRGLLVAEMLREEEEEEEETAEAVREQQTIRENLGVPRG